MRTASNARRPFWRCRLCHRGPFRADGQRPVPDDNEGKHLDMFNRRAERGQCFHQPCLGTREFAARFELLPPEAPLPAAPKRSRRWASTRRVISASCSGISTMRRAGRPSLFFRAELRERRHECARSVFAGDQPMSILASLAKAYERIPDAPASGLHGEYWLLVVLNGWNRRHRCSRGS